jgi:quercetin dioxygenase-like cupin family protein
MWKEKSTAKNLFCKEINSLHPSLFLFDFPALIEKMKQKHSWVNGDLDTMILLKTPTKQIVLTALHEGTEIKSFQSNESVTFQIIEGKLKFHTRKGSVDLEKDQLLNLSENVKYSLTTTEETVLLLTITNGLVQLSEN